MRERPYDQISVTLSAGAVKVTRPDTWTIEHSRFGAVHFDSKGTVVGEEGVSGGARRAMVFQIKSYNVPVEPDVAKFVQEKKAEGLPGQLDPRNGGVKLFENDRIAVWDKIYAPRGPVHVHYSQVAGVWIQPGVLAQIPVEQALPPCSFEAAARTPEGWPKSPSSPMECQSTDDALARFRAGQLTKVGEVRWHGPGTHHQEQGVGFPSYSQPGPRAIWIEFKQVLAAFQYCTHVAIENCTLGALT